jgi:anti-sigma B factor antagonist
VASPDSIPDDVEQYPSEMPDGARVLQLEGELDAYHAPEVRKRLHGLIDELDDGGVVVVDLAAVSFLDSTILGTLVGGLRRLREGGGELQLVYPRPPADRIFQLTGLDTVFPAARPRVG